MKYYVVKLLTNTKGEDAPSIDVYVNDETKTAHDKAIVAYHQTLAAYNNAEDVLYAVVMIVNEYGNTEILETVDHRTQPAPAPEVVEGEARNFVP